MATAIQLQTSERTADMTSASYFEDVIMTEAPPLPESATLRDNPRAAEPTEQRSPLSERLLNACVPAIRRRARKSLGGKENKVGASSTPAQPRRESSTSTQSEVLEPSTQMRRGLFAPSSETLVLDENGMIVESLANGGDPLAKFDFKMESAEAERRKEARGVFCDDLGADPDDADVMETYLRALRGGSGEFGGRAEKRPKPFWMRRLGWRTPGAQGFRFRPGKAIPNGDEMVFTSEEEQRRFFRYYPDGKAFPGRSPPSQRATLQNRECHVAGLAREKTPRARLADETFDDSWKMEMLLAQGRKLDDLSMLAEEFVCNSPYRSARAATWLKEMDARRGPLDLRGGSPTGYVACGRCGRKGSPEQMTKCKGGVTSRLLGGKSSGAEKGACEEGRGAPGKCGRELCKGCRSECAQCGEAVCGKHSWSAGFGCSRLRFCLTCGPSSANASKAADVTERHLDDFPCTLCDSMPL
ncbi:hypothetical protein KFL_004990030 [Klebsormidium nitens]|uniref:Uncharacterized protein n=1 Tax=Klebsormidium nitens TaxID=105231 RepID=A0A1Y1IM75_KLENI|nr:hypothetical protein KFL_004990030 [Klebsormidium nitens]|eukprot:GAQ89218.1 hypothetical protein KFL_004990030 [Klebsormidium nitens]